MTGGAAPYRKGREFENRVKRHLEQQGWFVVRQAGSAFPDLIGVPPKTTNKSVMTSAKSGGVGYRNEFIRRTGDDMYAIECKMCGYMSSPEIDQMIKIERGFGLVGVIASNEKGKISMRFFNCPKRLKMFKPTGRHCQPSASQALSKVRAFARTC